MADKVAELFGELGLNVDEKAWKHGNELIEHMHTALEAFAIFEGAKGLTEMVMGVVELGSKVNDLSMATGISTDALQEFGYIAKLNGGSMEEFAKSIGKLDKSMYEFATTGKGKSADAFRKLGITFQDAHVGSKDVESALGTLADRFAKMPDGPEKTALAMQFFGKAGAKMIPMLNEGRAGLEKLRKEARESGFVLSGESVKALDEFGDNIDRVKMSWQGVKNTVVTAVLPVLVELLERLSQWLAANREAIAETLKSFLESLATVFGVVGTAIGYVVDVINFLNNDLGVLQPLLVALGAVLGFVGAKAAWAWLKLLGPIGAIIAAITFIIALIYKFRAQIVAVLTSIGNWISRTWSAVVDAIKHPFVVIKDFFVGIATSIRDFFAGIIQWVHDKIAALKQAIVDMAVSILDNKYLKGLLELSGNSAQVKVFEDFAEGVRAQQRAERGLPAGGAGTNANVTVGDIHIHTDTNDPQKHAETVREHVDNMLRNTMHDVGGTRPKGRP